MFVSPLDRDSVRRLLNQIPTDADFDAFCLDFFPAVHKRFTATMDRVQRSTLLLQVVPDPVLIVDKLRERIPETALEAAARSIPARRRGVVIRVMGTALLLVAGLLLYLSRGKSQPVATSQPSPQTAAAASVALPPGPRLPDGATAVEQADDIHKQAGDHAGGVATLSNIGGVFEDHGDQSQALSYLEQARMLRKQAKDTSGEAATLNKIGEVYCDSGDKRKALIYYEQALPLFRQVREPVNEAITLHNIGRLYVDIGDKKRALSYLKQALTLFKQIDDHGREATTLHNIGRVYFELGDKQKALGYLKQALPLFKQVRNHEGENLALDNMAECTRPTRTSQNH